MKADLWVYGLIGFQDHWRRWQGYGGKNLAAAIVKNSLAKDVGIIALTSMEGAPTALDSQNRIIRDSVHDRFSRFKKELTQQDDYAYKSIGPNLLAITPNHGLIAPEPELYVVNAQKVITFADGDRSRRADILTVGANYIPNFMETGDLIDHAFQNNLMVIFTPDALSNSSEVDIKSCNAIAHSGNNLTPRNNNMAKGVALSLVRPFIGVSGSKTPGSIATAYMEFLSRYLDVETEKRFMNSLMDVVEDKSYENHYGYDNALRAGYTHGLFKISTDERWRHKLGV